MINQLIKTLPVLILGAGLIKGIGKSKSLFHVSRSMAAQTEVNLIAKTLRLHTLEGEPAPQTEEEFAQFLRENLKLPDTVKRDPALDMWGSPYVFDQGAARARVLSLGPDKALNTTDDVVAELAL